MKVKMRTTHRVELPSYLHCCGRGFDTASSRTQRESVEVIYENHADKLLQNYFESKPLKIRKLVNRTPFVRRSASKRRGNGGTLLCDTQKKRWNDGTDARR